MTETKQRIITLFVEHDEHAPAELDEWTFVSFNNKHLSYQNQDRYIKEYTAHREPVPVNIGLRTKLKSGHAFWLSYHEHGLCKWDLSGGSSCDGILLWEGKAKDLSKWYKTYDDRAKFAESVVEAYTHWCNGSVYSWFIQENGVTNIDIGGGTYYGEDGIEEDVADALKNFADAVVKIDGESGWILDNVTLPIPRVDENDV